MNTAKPVKILSLETGKLFCFRLVSIQENTIMEYCFGQDRTKKVLCYKQFPFSQVNIILNCLNLRIYLIAANNLISENYIHIKIKFVSSYQLILDDNTIFAKCQFSCSRTKFWYSNNASIFFVHCFGNYLLFCLER